MALAYEGNTDLAFDTALFNDCAEKYEGYAEDLNDISNELEITMAKLTDVSNGWNTPAGKKFKSMVVDDWDTNIEQYTDLLKTLADMIRQAAKDYESLYETDIENTKLEEG